MSSTDQTSSNTKSRLSQISTNWEELRAAHASSTDSNLRDAARYDVLRRYSGCAHQYILGATRDPHVAEDLSQEFALRFVRGDYKNANPNAGRFRDYLKTSLRNLVTDHFRNQKRDKTNLPDQDVAEPAQASPYDALEANFLNDWRQRVLHLAWDALKAFEEQKQNSFYTVLKLRAREPDLKSDKMAQLLSDQLGRTVTPEWVRQKLHRARARFAECLVEEIRRTLGAHEKDEVAEELAELGLQKYVDYQ